MKEREAYIVIVVVLLLFVLAQFADLTGDTILPSKRPKISSGTKEELSRRREPNVRDQRYWVQQQRNKIVELRPRERFPLMFNYTAIEIYVSDIFSTGRHPRPQPYPQYRLGEEPDDITGGKECTRWDGRPGHWNYDVYDLWVCV